ncbi:unnamed protein product, partial [Rotaria magnacalcarata]
MKTTLTLSYDILLVLFLEIHLHCFYHLSLLFRNASHYASVIDTDPDENIMRLNHDLTRLQETLHSSLNEKKFSFLFQGLGFVLATILIRSAPRFIRISETGVTKMCRNIFAIEQTRDASLACSPAGAWQPGRPGYRARLIFHILAWPASGQANNDQ